MNTKNLFEVRKIKKVSQKKFVKWARRYYTEKNIKKVIIFTRKHNGLFSYRDLMVFIYDYSILNFKSIDFALTMAEQLGCNKVKIIVNQIIYGECSNDEY